MNCWSKWKDEIHRAGKLLEQRKVMKIMELLKEMEPDGIHEAGDETRKQIKLIKFMKLIELM